MKYKAVIFDADGTLINSIQDLTNSGNMLLSEYGRPPHTVEEVCYLVGNGSRVYVERLFPDFGKEQIDVAFARYVEIYENHKFDNTCPYDGIEKMLDNLAGKGIKLAVFTNKHIEAARIIFDKIFPLHPFSLIVGDMPGIALKPSPQGALYIAERFGLKPAECVFMGDTKMDMQTAVNAGMLPVGVLWGFRTRKELEDNGAEVILSTPMELFDKVEF